MKRILLVVLILVVAAIAGAPYIFGALTKHQIEVALYNWNEDLQPQATASIESYDLGWFNSTPRIRIELASNEMQQAGAGFGATPAFILEGKIHHGPVPFTGSGVDGFKPLALALGDTKAKFTVGNAFSADLPGSLVTVVNMDGSTSYVYAAGQTPINFGETTGSWGGGRLEGSYDVSDGRIALNGRLEKAEVTGMEMGMEQTVVLGPMQVAVDQSKTDYGLSVGSASATLDEISVSASGMQVVSVDRLSLSQNSSVTGDKLTGRFEVSTNEISSPQMPGPGAISLKAEIRNFEARSTKKLLDTLQAATGSANPAAQMFGSLPAILPELQTILAGGPEFSIEELRITTGMGDMSLQLNLAFPEAGPGEQVALDPTLLFRMTGDAVISVSQSAVDMATMMQPQYAEQLQALLAMGWVRAEGDQYVVEAKWVGGSLTLNDVEANEIFQM